MLDTPDTSEPKFIKKWLRIAKKAKLKISPIDVNGSSTQAPILLARMWRVQGSACEPFICYTVNELIAFIVGYTRGVSSVARTEQ